MSLRCSVISILACILISLAGRAWATGPTIKVAEGVIQGSLSGHVAIFRGIPYAKPPVGNLRWEPPQPAEHWRGVRQATEFAPACIQVRQKNVMTPDGGLLPYIKRESEDCLYLNIWGPARAIKTPAVNKLPVMVWIHGGGFTVGTASAPHYEGSHFAEHGVVLVTVEYRLGRFGFFAHPALTAANPGEPLGNYAIMDMIAALKWVKSNIGAFGGDSSNITIFGESAGGAAVNTLITSPAARGLFSKVICESGGGRNSPIPVRGHDSRTGESVGLAFAHAVGIKGTGPEDLKALRALTPLQLATLPPGGGPESGMTGIMIDGVIVTESTMSAFKAGREAKVPYLIGGNSFEAILFDAQTQKNPDAVLNRAGPLRDRIMMVYGSRDKLSVAEDFLTESMMIEPARELARLHTRNGQNAWYYYYSFVPPSQRGKVHGLRHAGEIPYVFHTVSDHAVTGEFSITPPATPEDLSMSEKTLAYWVSFARNGNPDSAGGVHWPRWTPSEQAALEFSNGGPVVRPHFHQASLDLVEQIMENSAGPH